MMNKFIKVTDRAVKTCHAMANIDICISLWQNNQLSQQNHAQKLKTTFLLFFYFPIIKLQRIKPNLIAHKSEEKFHADCSLYL